ncbi:D-alanyl-D-alanine carboxypeptidase family protein [Clostridium sp. Cult3]|uniref:D-alanyl-D-alanine carboxypeptidase family protein n=1 Tax=Clostridium sp. Cult3 TaxID=2079004 RepID=UPI001F2CD8D7|nr:serine hydrolase [Clostridium sp. Cult3]MCF6459843.1 D-alanyl-D-alanine carboxypeptidase [Clostridium sp. Cult3]
MKKKFVRFMVFVIIIAAFIMDRGYLGALHIDGISNYSSKYIYVMNRENKNIEYEKNSNSRTYPASLTKIMTTIVALEHIENLSDIAPVDTDTYQTMVAKNSSMAGFYGKEAVTYRDLLYGTMLPSGGEAANSLAIHVAGSIEAFIKLMNEKALELGMENTHFTNVEGLDDDKQYTSAQDMAKLLDYALGNGDFRAIFTKKEFVTTKTLDHPNGINLKSTVLSKLEGIHQEGFEIIGGKSGTTSKAGQCWATLGTKNNQEYICIVMGAPLNDISNPDMKQREDTIKLYERIK